MEDKRSNPKRRFWHKMETADYLSIFAILITLIYGYKGCELQEQQIAMQIQQDSTSLDIKHFNSLLEKTDRILSKDSELATLSNNQIDTLVSLNNKLAQIVLNSSEQLTLNEQEQRKLNLNYEYAMIGNMNKLKNSIHQIESIQYSKELQFNSIQYNDKYLKLVCEKLELMKSIFVQEMSNPYLNSSDTMQELWSIAYGNVGEINRQISLEFTFLGTSVQNLNTGKTEIMQIDSSRLSLYLKKAYGDYFTSMGAALGYAFNKIKIDKIRRGILDKNGKYKINPESQWKSVK